jgi:two-component system, chemotaxis family, chemotaxis protein CheY
MATRILAVDDSKSVRQILTFTLRSAGFDVVEAEDGDDALEKAQAEPFSLVLTDHNMPRMDGITLIKSLRSLPAYRKAPILMLTTESSQEMKAQGRAAGATGWIVKPFDPARLLEVVRKIVA